ncbi:uncharacterized protein LOC142577695 [Dermacentor variabilis]|uniref:uncharacterized protein LOC142577695 n=1 Tax=Dermacentor variabilis TaxID=34621 RepID=UPI003F5C6E63
MRFTDAGRLFALQVLTGFCFTVGTCCSPGAATGPAGTPGLRCVGLRDTLTWRSILYRLPGNANADRRSAPPHVYSQLYAFVRGVGSPYPRRAGVTDGPTSSTLQCSENDASAVDYCAAPPLNGNSSHLSSSYNFASADASKQTSTFTHKTRHPLALISGLGSTPTMRFTDAGRLFALQASCDIMAALEEINSGQASLLSEMKSIRNKLSQNDKIFDDFKRRLTKIEGDVSAITALKTEVNCIKTVVDTNTKAISDISSRLNDSEDRARRSNLVFFGVSDTERETWQESEKKIVELCASNLNIKLDPFDIERAHRIGRYSSNRNRPIIIKLAHFKVKQHILSNAKQLRGSSYSISEDYSANTRHARKQLIEFGKSQQKPFKLRYDKLIVDNRSYKYDNTTNRVISTS